jgi:hypothetical protein
VNMCISEHASKKAPGSKPSMLARCSVNSKQPPTATPTRSAALPRERQNGGGSWSVTFVARLLAADDYLATGGFMPSRSIIICIIISIMSMRRCITAGSMGICALPSPVPMPPTIIPPRI